MMWEKKSLGVIADVYNGNSINVDYKKKHFLGLPEGLPFIATKDVLSNGEIDYDNGVKVPQDAGLKIAPADSVFVCAEGGSAGKKIAYVKEDVCFGNKLFCILPKKKELYSAKYIYYYCKSELFRAQFFGELTGLIGGVSAKKFRAIEIPIPPLPEQERIVSLLDAEFAKIDAIKANAEKQLQDAKALFQSALKDYLTPKDGWEEKTLKEITSKIGSGATPKGGRKVYIKEGCSLIRSMNVHYGFFKYDDLAYITDEAARQLNGVEIYEDDVLFNITGASIARCCVVPNDILPARVNQHVSILRTRKEMVLPTFLSYVLISPIHQKDLLQIGEAGSTRQALTKTNLEEHVISIPTIEEQHRIVENIEQLSAKIQSLQSNYETTVTHCNDLKQSILKDIFS